MDTLAQRTAAASTGKSRTMLLHHLKRRVSIPADPGFDFENNGTSSPSLPDRSYMSRCPSDDIECTGLLP